MQKYSSPLFTEGATELASNPSPEIKSHALAPFSALSGSKRKAVFRITAVHSSTCPHKMKNSRPPLNFGSISSQETADSLVNIHFGIEAKNSAHKPACFAVNSGKRAAKAGTSQIPVCKKYTFYYCGKRSYFEITKQPTNKRGRFEEAGDSNLFVNATLPVMAHPVFETKRAARSVL